MTLQDTLHPRNTVGRFATKEHTTAEVDLESWVDEVLEDGAPEGFGEPTNDDFIEMVNTPVTQCSGCGKPASEIAEYAPESTGDDLSAEEYVRQNEGTYNPATGAFACTPCYIGMGMPSALEGWTA